MTAISPQFCFSTPGVQRSKVRVRPVLEREVENGRLATDNSLCRNVIGAPLPGCYHGCIAMAHERVYIATEDKPVLIGSKDDPVPEGIKVARPQLDCKMPRDD